VCMLRREVRNDVKTLNSYLAARFPEIPAGLRDAIIFSTFKTAQKVAVTHTDALLPESDIRGIWARRYMAIWGHGLSFPEPTPAYGSEEPQGKSSDPDQYLPVNDFLADKELPVPFDSATQKEEAERDFNNATLAIMEAAKETANEGRKQLLSKKAVTSTLETVAMEIIQTTVAQIDGGVAITNPEMAYATTSNETQVVPPPKQNATLVVSAIVHNEPQVAPTTSLNIPQVVSTADGENHALMSGVVPSVSGGANEMHSTPLRASEEGEILESPILNDPGLTFNDLLPMGTSDRELMDDLNQPLYDLVTPVVTPLKEKGSSQVVPGVNPTSSSAIPQEVEPVNAVSTVGENPMATNTESRGNHSLEPKTPKKARLDKPAKENADRHNVEQGENRTLKRKVPVSKAVKKPCPKSISWRERKSCSRPRSFVTRPQPRDDEEELEFRRPLPEIKIPLKPRQNEPDRYQDRRPRSPYRDEQYGRYGGFGRGYRSFPGAGRGASRSLQFSGPERVPGFTPEQQRWLDHVVPMWKDRR